MEGNKLLKVREVAERLNISRSSVYRLFWEGKLKGIKLGSGLLRIWASSVEGFLHDAQAAE